MKLILLGAPGAGKGTQAEVICQRLNIPAVSTGNLLREAVKNQTELGKAAQSYMEKGELVPDELVIRMLQARLEEADCAQGFILDGFPRTVPQAEALEQLGIRIDRVIDLEVSDEEITQRMSGRRVCESCGASYHLAFKPTRAAGVCDKCGGKTVLRKDDQPETVQERLRIYHRQTEPLIDYYRTQNKLYTVNGHSDLAVTTARTLEALEAQA